MSQVISLLIRFQLQTIHNISLTEHTEMSIPWVNCSNFILKYYPLYYLNSVLGKCEYSQSHLSHSPTQFDGCSQWIRAPHQAGIIFYTIHTTMIYHIEIGNFYENKLHPGDY